MNLSKEELTALKREYASQATDEQFLLWISMCERRGLVPVEDIVLQLRSSREYDEQLKSKVYVKRAIYITTIRALLRLAERTGKYKGFVPAEYVYLDSAGLPTMISQIPLPDPRNTDKPLTPWAARVGVKRAGFDDPQYTVCRFGAYAQYFSDSDGKKTLNNTWATRGSEQLVKCCKAAALREAFPEELGGLYLHEEFQDDDETPKSVPAPAQATTSAATTVAPPATVAPPVNQVPAEGKVAPRPGEKKEIVVSEQAVKEADDLLAEIAAAKTEPPAGSPKEAVKEPDKKPDIPGGGKRVRAKRETTKPSETAAIEAAKEPAPKPDPTEGVKVEDANRLPTKAERSEILGKISVIRDRVGGAGSEHSQQLRTFILTRSKKADTKDVLLQEWIDIFKALESAVDDADLKGIITKG